MQKLWTLNFKRLSNFKLFTMKKNIAGIQQIGIGVPDVKEAFRWYQRNFGMDIPIFEEVAEANLMLPYTGGKPHKRHAILAINLKGGGGFEIWQYTSRTPQPPVFKIQLGDLGIYCSRIKSNNVRASYEKFRSEKLNLITELVKTPNGNEHFFLQDPYGNVFEIVEGGDWFGKGTTHTGGTAGCIIGVSDMEKSMLFYKEILGYDTVIYDEEGIFDDLKNLPGGSEKMRRVLLKHDVPRKGSFSKLLGLSQIELVKVYNREPKKIFANRYWGDLGFIHLCFDVTGMTDLKKECEAKGFPFTVDSASSFDMGEAAGHFSYIEDPDGTLIEFVETHKLPILKIIGWYLNLKRRDPEKALPNWMLKSLVINRVKG